MIAPEITPSEPHVVILLLLIPVLLHIVVDLLLRERLKSLHLTINVEGHELLLGLSAGHKITVSANVVEVFPYKFLRTLGP
jgi:hypothetical protein